MYIAFAVFALICSQIPAILFYEILDKLQDRVIFMKKGPYEIERKYLIRYPDLQWLDAVADKSEIEQIYLKAADGVTARLRFYPHGETKAFRPASYRT